MLRDLRSQLGVPIHYGAAPEKERFRDRLVGDYRFDRALIEFALFDPFRTRRAIGANRNSLLLQTAGAMALFADDDSVCRIVRPPASASILALTSGVYDEWWFFKDRRQAENSLSAVDVDILGAHESLLGKSPAFGTVPFGNAVQLDRAREKLIRRLISGSGRVLMTWSGLWGDHAMPWVSWFLQLRDESRERLLRSATDYRVALCSREVLRLSPTPAICESVEFWAPVVGLDNRQLLPPFLPFGIGEDMTFCATMTQCLADASQGLVPLAVLHAPVERRALVRDSVWRSAGNVFLWDVVCAAIRSFETEVPRDPGASLAAMGEHLIRLGALPPEDFRELIRDRLWQRLSGTAAALQDLAAQYGGKPAFWMEDVERQWRQIEKSVRDPNFPVPQDLREGRRPGAASDLTREVVGQFGRLLMEWPRLVAASRELVSGGRGPARPLR
jgi:hypothetical protein